MRVQSKVVEVRDIFKGFNELRVFVCNMLLNKRGSLEQFLAVPAPELALVLLLDMRLNKFG